MNLHQHLINNAINRFKTGYEIILKVLVLKTQFCIIECKFTNISSSERDHSQQLKPNHTLPFQCWIDIQKAMVNHIKEQLKLLGYILTYSTHNHVCLQVTYCLVWNVCRILPVYVKCLRPNSKALKSKWDSTLNQCSLKVFSRHSNVHWVYSLRPVYTMLYGYWKKHYNKT